MPWLFVIALPAVNLKDAIDAGNTAVVPATPRPVPQFKREDPKDYAQLMRQPGFLRVRAFKPPEDARRLLGGA